MSGKDVAVSRRGGITPTNYDDLWRMCVALSNSGMVPQDYIGKPEACLASIQTGMEVGLQPMTALSWIACINGRPCIWGDGLKALVMSSGLVDSYEESREYELKADGTPDESKPVAVVRVSRVGMGGVHTERLTWSRCKVAGWVGKSGPWSKDFNRMQMNRARTYAFRDLFPDVILGLSVREEVEDLPPAKPVRGGAQEQAPAQLMQPSEQPAITLGDKPEADPVPAADDAPQADEPASEARPSEQTAEQLIDNAAQQHSGGALLYDEGTPQEELDAIGDAVDAANG